MDENGALAVLLEKAFQMAGERAELGFDLGRIAKTVAKLPNGLDESLQSLFKTSWPAESYFLGAIELLGPERINDEHESLLPGCLIIKHGFLCIGSDGGGTMYGYCVGDQKVYLIPHEYVSEDAVYAKPWEQLDVTSENIKAISEQTWDSLTSLFEWSLVELNKMDDENKKSPEA